MRTVHVIESADGSILGVSSWKDDPKGNKEAEEHFILCVKENTSFSAPSDEEVQEAVENGFYEEGDYKVTLTHSSLGENNDN